MTKQQIKDMKKCEELQEQGIDMDCWDCWSCSCNCCIAQETTTRMFDNKDLMLIREALKEYRNQANSILLTTNEQELHLHEKAKLDVDESNELLNRVEVHLKS